MTNPGRWEIYIYICMHVSIYTFCFTRKATLLKASNTRGLVGKSSSKLLGEYAASLLCLLLHLTTFKSLQRSTPIPKYITTVIE